MNGRVFSVNRSAAHTFVKPPQQSITLLEGLGVEGDAHLGTTVKHRSRVRQNPTTPNLRQVHLIPLEIIEEVNGRGFMVDPGDMGENITTSGLTLIDLPRDTVLRLGERALIRITGLRNPCFQLDDFQQGLMAAVLDRNAAGEIVRRAGVMSVVLQGGDVKPGDVIEVILPDGPHEPLLPV